MVTSSKFVQLNSYALLQYEYNSAVISTNDCNFLKIRNAYSGTISYVNYNSVEWNKPRDLTGNILDRTVLQVGENTWAHLDTDKPVTYYETKHQKLT